MKTLFFVESVKFSVGEKLLVTFDGMKGISRPLRWEYLSLAKKYVPKRNGTSFSSLNGAIEQLANQSNTVLIQRC